MGVWNVLNLKIDIRKIRGFVGTILMYVYGRLEYLSGDTPTREIQLVQLTAMSAFHAGGEEAINSSIADESSSSYAFAISLISTKLDEADPE